MKNILLISTGGTIASTQSNHGLAPSLNGDDIISLVSGIDKICHLDGITIFNIDSSNMSPDFILAIADTVKSNYDKYDGFVISHGTDTMAYTSSLLSYLLMDVDKPVVITGAQVPMIYSNTDAKNNILDAIKFACEDIRGVYIAFNRKLILGTRAKKIKSKNLDAFESINFPLAGEIKDNHVLINPDLALSETSPNVLNNFDIDLNPNIFILKLFPGIDPDIFDFIQDHYKGIIIEGFGIGGIPNNLVERINNLIDRGIIVVISTQCIDDGVTLNVYEVGSLIQDDKIITGADMTTEALSAKLMFALGNFDSFEQIKNFIESPLFYDREA